MNNYTFRKACRICNNPNLIRYFDFGKMPLANAFKKPGQKEELFFPQEVMFCDNCANSQLSVVVNPEVLFSNYLYFSSVSKTFQDHCAELAYHFTKLFNKKLKCLDIASNDGCLLKEFKQSGHEVIGVEPAENISKIANEKGINTINGFWGSPTSQLVLDHIGKVDIVTALNVFAHVDDVHSFVENVVKVLDDNGLFVIEFPYMRNLIKYSEFDTIYHEHLSYFLVKPILHLLNMHKMKIYNISEYEIHGGTIQIAAIKESNKMLMINDSVKRYLDLEKNENLHSIKGYQNLETAASKIKNDFINKLKEIKSLNKKIAGYGASAKGNVFVNYCNLDVKDICYIVDDTKAKQGSLYAGTQIPIVDSAWIEKEKPDYIVILPWNFAKEIMNKTSKYKKEGGKYIIALPELRID